METNYDSLFLRLSKICHREASYEELSPQRKLFAIILAESDKFGNSFKESMEDILEQTPESIKIISFYEAPKYWKRVLETSKDSRKHSICCDRDYNFEFIKALKKRFGIGDGSYIVLTDDLRSKKFYAIQTSRKQVVNQLIEIGRQSEHFHKEDDKYLLKIAVKAVIDLRPRQKELTTSNRLSIAKNITEIMAIWAISSRDENEKKVASQCVKQTLRSLKKKSDAAHDDEEKAKTALDRYSDYYQLVVQARQRVKNNVLYYLPLRGYEENLSESFSDDLMSFQTEFKRQTTFNRGSIRGFQLVQKKEEPYEKFIIKGSLYNELEKDSKYELANYNLLLPSLIGKESQNASYDFFGYGFDFLDGDFQIDLKPLGAHLANIIEEELNASVIQLIRTLFEIEMPDYYRLFDRHKDWCAIDTFGKKIYFNKRHKEIDSMNYSVKPVLMGELGCVLRKQLSDGNWENALGLFSRNQFIDDITLFAKMRNESSHPGPMDMNEFEKLFNAFQRIVGDYLEPMFAIKREMSYLEEKTSYSGNTLTE